MDAADPSLAVESLLAHDAWLRALVGGLVAADDAADVAQETWLRCVASPPRHPGTARAWLARVAGNLARRLHRTAARRHRRELLAARPEACPSADALIERVELQQRIAEAVLALDEPYRAAIVLRYVEGLDAAVIARRRG